MDDLMVERFALLLAFCFIFMIGGLTGAEIMHDMDKERAYNLGCAHLVPGGYKWDDAK